MLKRLLVKANNFHHKYAEEIEGIEGAYLNQQRLPMADL